MRSKLTPSSELDTQFGTQRKTTGADAHTIEHFSLEANLVIGAVLVPSKLAPKLLAPASVARMRRGAVIVDVAIDQGGCIETSRVTSHSNPFYVDEGVVHYCVGKMPGAVAYAATLALTQETLPYALALAQLGLHAALRADTGLANGVQAYRGHITHAGIAADLRLAFTPLHTMAAL